MEREWIARYRAAADEPTQLLMGLTAELQTALPIAGTWSIRQILWHMVDADLILGDRMRRIIAEDRPTLIGFDESLFAARLSYQDRDPTPACQLFALHRRLTADLLELLPDSDFERVGIHNEKGPLTLAELLRITVTHWEHHRGFIIEKRRMLNIE